VQAYKEERGLEQVEVVLVASPFLRTIMTAQGVGMALRKLQADLQLRVDY